MINKIRLNKMENKNLVTIKQYAELVSKESEIETGYQAILNRILRGTMESVEVEIPMATNKRRKRKVICIDIVKYPPCRYSKGRPVLQMVGGMLVKRAQSREYKNGANA